MINHNKKNIFSNFYFILTNSTIIPQVQLLVSDSDVESYKQIKADLDVLRQSVEKSELWVYKSKATEDHSGKKKSSKDDEDDTVTTHKPKPLLTDSEKKSKHKKRITLLRTFFEISIFFYLCSYIYMLPPMYVTHHFI